MPLSNKHPPPEIFTTVKSTFGRNLKKKIVPHFMIYDVHTAICMYPKHGFDPCTTHRAPTHVLYHSLSVKKLRVRRPSLNNGHSIQFYS